MMGFFAALIIHLSKNRIHLEWFLNEIPNILQGSNINPPNCRELPSSLVTFGCDDSWIAMFFFSHGSQIKENIGETPLSM